MDGFDSVRDAEPQSEEIFSTILPKHLAQLIGRTHMPNNVIDNVITNYNSGDIETLDDYLLYEGEITQDEREIIIESIFVFSNKS